MEDTQNQESELIKKCKAIAMSGEERLSGKEGKRYSLLSNGLRVDYQIDWGGRQYISVFDRSDLNLLLTASNPQKNDHPVESPIIMGEDGFKINIYEKGAWEERINSIYSALVKVNS